MFSDDDDGDDKSLELYRIPVEQRLVSLRTVIKKDSEAFAKNAVKQELTIEPSSVRGNTLGSTQGDHASAYALYWERTRVEIAEYIKGNTGFHVSVFVSEIYYRPSKEMKVLARCGLFKNPEKLLEEINLFEQSIIAANYRNKGKGSVARDSLLQCEEKLNSFKEFVKTDDGMKFQKEMRMLSLKLALIKHMDSWAGKLDVLLEEIQILQEIYGVNIEEAIKQAREIKELYDLSKQLTPRDKAGVAPKVTRLIEKVESLELHVRSIEERKKKLREDYFYKAIRDFSEVYLLYQNQMPYVAFEKIPGLEASNTEGVEIRTALIKLRNYNDGFSTSLEAKDHDEILTCVDNLLFFPKVPKEILVGLDAKKEEILSNNRKSIIKHIFIRDNDTGVFSYIIARHLNCIFDAFPKLCGQQAIREKIKNAFIDKMLIEWKWGKAEVQQIRQTIDDALQIYSENSGSTLDISLLGSPSPVKRSVSLNETVSPPEPLPIQQPDDGGSSTFHTRLENMDREAAAARRNTSVIRGRVLQFAAPNIGAASSAAILPPGQQPQRPPEQSSSTASGQQQPATSGGRTRSKTKLGPLGPEGE